MFRNLSSFRTRSKHSFARPLAVESLERRDMLTAGPRVVAVEVASTTWAPAFVSYLQSANLGTNGYAIPFGSTAQSSTLPWTNLDQIRIKFDTDAVLSSSSLSISGVNQTAYAFTSFRYNPLTQWATWTLATPINSDRLQLDLDANGARPVSDFGANVLDGEWTNNSSTVSGNGTAGGDFEFRFNVLPADVNNSASVTLSDSSAILLKVGQSTASSGYDPLRDINGSGVIDTSDELAAVGRLLQTLPTGSPAGANNDAPTTSLFALYQMNETTGDIEIALDYAFADAESGSNGLTYSIVSNSNPGVINSASINPTTHRLTVSAASGVSGRTSFTIRATDPNGLFVDTPLPIDVNRENLPPVIEYFYSGNTGADTYYFFGHVYDPDDDVSDLIVHVYGDFFEIRTVVDENGNFEFAVILEPDAWGFEFATAFDLHGLESNTREDFIGLT